MNRYALMLALCCSSALVACSSSDDDESRSTSEHEVYFVGYAYNGATGARLTAAQVTAISIKYRDRVVATTIEADGRFVTVEPLPTWQDYAVYIGAPGFRPFVSRNPGIDVPASLAMTDGVAGTKTVQTFQIEASLLPVDLKAPKVTLTIETSDALTTVPAPARAAGSLRLRPQSASVLEAQTLSQAQQPSNRRRWFNDEDLLTQTVTKPFTDGKAEIAEGELLYGVPYQITVFGVPGYQPLVSTDPLVAGQVSTKTVIISKELRDPLRILAINTDTCVPPAGNSTDYGAALTIDFSEAVEFVSANAAEDIDNGVIVTPVAPFSGSLCPLRTSISPTMQERGTRATLEGSRLTLAFNPSVGFSTTTSSGFTCTVPASFTGVTYGNLTLIGVRPVGDQTRKRTLGELVASFQNASGSPSVGSGSLTCGTRSNAF